MRYHYIYAININTRLLTAKTRKGSAVPSLQRQNEPSSGNCQGQKSKYLLEPLELGKEMRYHHYAINTTIVS